ncbi:hypothetical protein GW17_00058871 [Ensete ventricosum]|nr:hypothetical protein GW17_00058871 [Ensete ventricosum]
MHPLRFPNSGIRTKVFVRKISFKLRVMRLNRVESFNAFAARKARRRGWLWLAARGSRLRLRPPARGRLATAKPPCRGGWLQPRPPCKGAVGHLQGAITRKGNMPQGAATRGCGRLPAAHPQGPAASGKPARGCPWRTRKGRRRRS